jgi:hypothetical protein
MGLPEAMKFTQAWTFSGCTGRRAGRRPGFASAVAAEQPHAEASQREQQHQARSGRARAADRSRCSRAGSGRPHPPRSARLSGCRDQARAPRPRFARSRHEAVGRAVEAPASALDRPPGAARRRRPRFQWRRAKTVDDPRARRAQRGNFRASDFFAPSTAGVFTTATVRYSTARLFLPERGVDLARELTSTSAPGPPLRGPPPRQSWIASDGVPAPIQMPRLSSAGQ